MVPEHAPRRRFRPSQVRPYHPDPHRRQRLAAFLPQQKAEVIGRLVERIREPLVRPRVDRSAPVIRGTLQWCNTPVPSVSLQKGERVRSNISAKKCSRENPLYRCVTFAISALWCHSGGLFLPCVYRLEAAGALR